MQHEFWLERWERGETGFHQDEVNACLIRHWIKTGTPKGVFVPLCGKSLDLWWLRQQGHEVLGVELSERAVQAFFEDAGQQPAVIPRGQFKCYESEGISLWCGDFFKLRIEDVQGCGAVYDRASLIALPPVMREAYARHLVSLFPEGIRMLLITLDYDQTEMQGPPFAVTEREIDWLYGQWGRVELLEKRDALPENARLRQRGLNRLDENTYLIEISPCGN